MADLKYDRREEVMSLATSLDCVLKLSRSMGDRVRLYMDSSLERLDFSLRISWVMKGLRFRERHEMVLAGACLSRRSVRVESNRER